MISNDDLLKWVNKMPLWYRKATALYYQNNVITDEEIINLADCCFRDEPFMVEKINLITHGNKPEFMIKSISGVKGVNAICSDRPLNFNVNGITVVYGLNGSGKSGYIRILKMISGAKYREEIINNIYTAKPIHPEASITITSPEGKDFKYVCDLRKPGEHDALTNIDIFDTRISNAYMREAKEAAYEPWVFGYFAYMAEVADRIKRELETRKNKCVKKPYAFPENLKDSDSYRKLDSISYTSKLNDFPSVWSEKEENELIDLKSNNQAVVLKTKLERNQDRIKNTMILKSYIDSFSAFFSEQNWDSIQKTKQKLQKAIKVNTEAEMLFKQNASDHDASSVDVESWKALWKYARQYYDSVIFPEIKIGFTQNGSVCPLCGQIVADHDCIKRMESIDSYVNGKVLEEERRLREEYNALLEQFPLLKHNDEIEAVIDLAGIPKQKKEVFVSQNILLESYSSELHDKKTNIDIEKFDISILSKIVSEHLSFLEEERKTIDEDMSSEKQILLEETIRELEATKQLTTQFATIDYNIRVLSEIHEIEIAEKQLSTNRITSKSKELATHLITADYLERFQREMQSLTKNNLDVKLEQQRAGKGKIPYKVVLVDSMGNNVSPQEILSEGENRVTSLAAFFAETSGRQENVPLVFDDPISSLDYNYENLVISRLLQAASARQVVVFTHRISMVVGLCDGAKKKNINYSEVSLRSSKRKKGVPYDNSDIGGKAGAKLNTLINNDLAKLKKTIDDTSEEYEKAFHSICHEFRNIVEKSIEEVLIGGVVQRFRKDIQTQNRLYKLSEITREDCEMFDQLMTKYSYYDHSMSDEAPLNELTIDELESDLKRLQLWIKTRGN